MAISFVASSTLVLSLSSDTVARPSGVDTDDVLICISVSAATSGTQTGPAPTPSGWGVRFSGNWEPSNQRRNVSVSYHTVDDIDTEPASYTVDRGAVNAASTTAIVLAYRGVDTLNIFDIATDHFAPSTSSFQSSYSIPVATTVSDGATVLHAAIRNSPQTITSDDSGMDYLLTSSSSGKHIDVFDREYISAGVTSSGSVTYSGPTHIATYLTALAPAGAGGGGGRRFWSFAQIVE